MTMDTEIEAKFYPVNKDTYRKRLRSIGAKLIIPERLMRRAIIDRRSHPEFVCDYIRVRDEGNLVRLSAKVHTDQTGSLGDQKEIDVVVSDFDRTLQLFESMGYKFDHFMETLRETWAYQGAEITIDTWPCLQPLSEIEAKSVNQQPYPWAILSDGMNILGLHQTKDFDYPAITYFAPDMSQRVQKLKEAGITSFADWQGQGGKEGNFILTTPEGQKIFLFSF